MTRGKLWTGFLGLGLAGVAATANPRCRPAELGEPPLPSLPAAPKPVAQPKPVDLALPSPKTVDVAPPLPTVTLDLPPISAAPPAVSGPSSSPKIGVGVALPPPAVTTNATTPNLRGVETPIQLPAPTQLEPTKPALADLQPPPVRGETPAVPVPRWEPALPTPSPAPAAAAKTETAVKVVMKLGDGRPRLDVQNGEDTILKVCADKMDVRSPSERGEPMSALKAAGKVSFTTPGCSGTCDDLTVFPRTGEVILAGNVCITCREGKGETTLTADVLKFKVPAAPSYGLPEPLSVVPVSLRK